MHNSVPAWLDPYDFDLPPEQIAQHPLQPRDQSRLMVLRRGEPGSAEARFHDLPGLLPPGAVLVMNNTRVLPRRLRGWSDSGRALEVLLLQPALDSAPGQGRWTALVKPARRLKPGQGLLLGDGHIAARAVQRTGGADFGGAQPAGALHGGWVLEFAEPERLPEQLQAHGLAPLPPYIRREAETEGREDIAAAAESAERRALQNQTDRQAYQTVYAKVDGAIAAPTAGLHFTPGLLERLRQAGVPLVELTLHVGLGTFAPIHAPQPEQHVMHAERFSIAPEAARAVLEARVAGRPVIAVGTTTVRCLETWALRGFALGDAGSTDLFIREPAVFRAVDGMLTNFHLPRSTLLMLVAAFHGRERLLEAYRLAVRQGYRFFSFGDCMAILPAA